MLGIGRLAGFFWMDNWTEDPAAMAHATFLILSETRLQHLFTAADAAVEGAGMANRIGVENGQGIEARETIVDAVIDATASDLAIAADAAETAAPGAPGDGSRGSTGSGNGTSAAEVRIGETSAVVVAAAVAPAAEAPDNGCAALDGSGFPGAAAGAQDFDEGAESRAAASSPTVHSEAVIGSAGGSRGGAGSDGGDAEEEVRFDPPESDDEWSEEGTLGGEELEIDEPASGKGIVADASALLCLLLSDKKTRYRALNELLGSDIDTDLVKLLRNLCGCEYQEPSHCLLLRLKFKG